MNNSKEPTKVLYPRFIANKPDGNDLYEGKSQNSLAESLVQFLTENDNINRKVIGIEGEWGSGKSNVIEILKNKLSDSYYFFVFDAWGHQEDLTRRSILEGLLIKLMKDSVLVGDKWTSELETLLSKKVKREHKSIPKLSWAVLLSIFGILLTPISTFIAEQYLKSLIITASRTAPASAPAFINYIFAGVIILTPFVCLLGWIIYSLCKAEKDGKKKVLEELFYLYKGEEIINTSLGACRT